MKKYLLFILSTALIMSLNGLSAAQEIDEGVAAENPSAIEVQAVPEDPANINLMDDVAEDTFGPSAARSVPSAQAVITGTEAGSLLSGTVDFVQTDGGVQVVAIFSNVTPPGKHGFHIHAQGSCEDGGNAAGGHFDPMESTHGFLPHDGSSKAHAGDMGNIEIDAQGNGTLVIFMPGLSLVDGPKNIAGKAVIVHTAEDDFGQPTGNAGGRIGCGLIELSK